MRDWRVMPGAVEILPFLNANFPAYGMVVRSWTAAGGKRPWLGVLLFLPLPQLGYDCESQLGKTEIMRYLRSRLTAMEKLGRLRFFVSNRIIQFRWFTRVVRAENGHDAARENE